jgi:hypothetical protein
MTTRALLADGYVYGLISVLARMRVAAKALPEASSAAGTDRSARKVRPPAVAATRTASRMMRADLGLINGGWLLVIVMSFRVLG